MAYSPLPPLGQTVMASSLPVTLASNQPAIAVSQTTQPLPTGAATEATLSAASAKLPATLGQKLMAASLAVAIASDQGAIPVTGSFYQATQPVSIAATVAVSGPLTDTQLRASAVPVSVATLPLPTGAATEATLAAASAKLPATLGQTTMANSLSVALASNQSAIPVTQSGTWNVGTVTTVSGVTTVSTVTNLAQMGGQAISMGTGVRDAGTQRVTIATNDSVPVTGTFWQATQPVSGTFWQATQPVSLASVPLPTGAATEATLSAMSGKLPATLGQKAMSASMAVVISSDQSNVPTYHANAAVAATQITALDAVVAAPAGAGATVSGSSTAGSLVALALTGGESNVDVFFSGGTFTGDVWFEGSLNSGNGTTGSWISIQGHRLGINETTLAVKHTAAGSSANNVYRVPCAGFTYVRCRLVGSSITSGPNIVMVASAGQSGTTILSSLPAGDNNIGNVDIASAIPAGANEIGGVNITKLAGTAVSVNAGTPDAGTQRVMLPTPTNHALNSAATTNATSIKGSAGTVYGIICYNANAAVRYVKYYNKATAPTVGTDTPMFVIAVPATGFAAPALGALGIRFGTGIGLATTTGAADTDTGAVAANDIKVDTSYV